MSSRAEPCLKDEVIFFGAAALGHVTAGGAAVLLRWRRAVTQVSAQHVGHAEQIVLPAEETGKVQHPVIKLTHGLQGVLSIVLQQLPLSQKSVKEDHV